MYPPNAGLNYTLNVAALASANQPFKITEPDHLCEVICGIDLNCTRFIFLI